MNRHEPFFSPGREAKLRYLDADFQVLSEGDHVRCAVTSLPIKLEDLRSRKDTPAMEAIGVGQAHGLCYPYHFGSMKGGIIDRAGRRGASSQMYSPLPHIL